MLGLMDRSDLVRVGQAAQASLRLARFDPEAAEFALVWRVVEQCLPNSLEPVAALDELRAVMAELGYGA